MFIKLFSSNWSINVSFFLVVWKEMIQYKSFQSNTKARLMIIYTINALLVNVVDMKERDEIYYILEITV